ncbi:MAG: SRPBCC family protein [Bacteroidota bacterium]
MNRPEISNDIKRAHTLPGNFYNSAAQFEAVTEKIFARSWLYLTDVNAVRQEQLLSPFTLLPGVLDEPIVLSCDRRGELHCLSNVCTHRGAIIVEQQKKGRLLSCGYHGRCFSLDGKFRSMPAFEATENFPTEADHLHLIPFAERLKLLFVSLQPRVDFGQMFQPILDRVGWLPLDQMVYNEAQSRTFHVKANWALYCDNYLEGLHIPFVHPSLNEALSFEDYAYELFPYCNLQLGVAKSNENCFDLPASSVDYGKNIYAYYFWLFPNLMFNFYPWGLSLNVVEPINHQETRVVFKTYLFPDAQSEREINRIDETEYEDEAVVESVQRGLRSRFYDRGRYSPSMEQCVHHFHRLIADFLEH